MSHEVPPLEIVTAYHRAWTSGDIDGAMDLVAPDVVARVPGADLEGREQWREYLAGFQPMLTGVVDLHALADGDTAVLFSLPQTAATSTAVAAEHFTLREGKIAEIVLVFDRLSYGPPDA